ncbi:MAG: hypothetical protein E7350_04580 [Clostridiales bacterium]|nr:hypothetical protein [Clostridiales bacterium]
MRDSPVLGCVAGEDTVMAVCPSEQAARETMEKLYEIIK